MPLIYECKICEKEFNTYPCRSKNGKGKFCSTSCYRKSWLEKKHSPETKLKMSIAKMGENHWNWKGIHKTKRQDRRNDPAYKCWRREIYQRDNWKCRISNESCEGRMEAHHILGWSEYPGLRYEVNNGITLCRCHHPKKRMDEIKLAPVFQNMISVLAN